MTIARKTPLTGTGFLRSKTRGARPVGVLGQASHQAIAKVRQRKCAICRAPFSPISMTHKACGPDCAAVVAERARAKNDRKALAEFRERTKRKADHVADAQKAFNSWIRARDAGLPCICCGLPLGTGTTGGAYDAGHYRSVGSAPHMRFIEANCHAQRKHCNNYLSGNAVAYRAGLIARIGLEAVEALEADNEPRKYTVDELKAIRAKYKQKLKLLKEK